MYLLIVDTLKYINYNIKELVRCNNFLKNSIDNKSEQEERINEGIDIKWKSERSKFGI